MTFHAIEEVFNYMRYNDAYFFSFPSIEVLASGYKVLDGRNPIFVVRCFFGCCFLLSEVENLVFEIIFRLIL
jgi:hypothetical protein